MTGVRSQTVPLQPASRRGLRAIIGANIVSTLGDGAFIAAAPLAAAAVTRDPAAVALVAAAASVPWVLVAPFAGVFVDRWPRRMTMIVADALRAGAVAVLAVMIATGNASVLAIAICAFVIAAGTVFHSAAAEAVVADLAERDPDTLNRVNGTMQSTMITGRQMLGPPAGSWSWSVAGWLPFAADAISYALSAVIIFFVPKSKPASTVHNGVFKSMREGARFLFHHQQLLLLALLTGAANVSYNAGMATLVLYATDTQGLDIKTAEYGLLLTAMATGGFVGGFLASRLSRAVGDRAVFIGGMLAEAAAWTVVLSTHLPVLAGGALAVIGFSVSCKSVVIMSTRQRLVPTALLGRVISAYRVIGNGMSPIGAVAGGLVAHQWGLRAAMGFAAAVMLIAPLAAIRALRQPVA